MTPTERDELVRELRDLAGCDPGEAGQYQYDHPVAEHIATKVAAFIEHSTAREAALVGALKAHHDWHLNSGTVGLPDGEGGWVEIDNAAEYSDSAMCERTMAALSDTSPQAEALLKVVEAAKKMTTRWYDFEVRKELDEAVALRGPWRIKRPMGCAIWNVWREDQHVAYMPSLFAAQQYCERRSLPSPTLQRGEDMGKEDPS